MLFVALVLFIQIAGLHFHVHDALTVHVSAPKLLVHVAYSDSHDACHENDCGIDLAMTEFWKNPDQGWDVLALFAVVYVLLLSVRSRGVPRLTFTDRLPRSQPIFLRPPLRAPPL
jgi:hypothetical protein